MYIYIIKTRNQTKIGITRNIAERLKTYSYNSPDFGEWEILAIPVETEEKAKFIESEVKREYQNNTNNISSEWFFIKAEIIIEEVRKRIEKYKDIKIDREKYKELITLMPTKTSIQTIKTLIELYTNNTILNYGASGVIKNGKIVLYRNDFYNLFHEINKEIKQLGMTRYQIIIDLNKIFEFDKQTKNWVNEWNNAGFKYLLMPNIEDGKRIIKAYINNNKEIKRALL
jgi:hypothetical protein